jgi:Uma2 family endonuclease
MAIEELEIVPPITFSEELPDLPPSPSTARTDRVVKFYAYERARVREYWLVAPRTHSIEVYVPNERQVFEQRGQCLPGDTLTSSVLPDLTLAVDSLFVAEAA